MRYYLEVMIDHGNREDRPLGYCFDHRVRFPQLGTRFVGRCFLYNCADVLRLVCVGLSPDFPCLAAVACRPLGTILNVLGCKERPQQLIAIGNLLMIHNGKSDLLSLIALWVCTRIVLV